jgi:hypothetical protein
MPPLVRRMHEPPLDEASCWETWETVLVSWKFYSHQKQCIEKVRLSALADWSLLTEPTLSMWVTQAGTSQ